MREGITRPNEQTYSSILKCLLENKDLFEAYKTTTEELTLSVSEITSQNILNIYCLTDWLLPVTDNEE